MVAIFFVIELLAKGFKDLEISIRMIVFNALIPQYAIPQFRFIRVRLRRINLK